MEEERKAKTIYFSKEEDLVLLDKLDSYIKLTKSNPNVTSETTTGIVRKLIKDLLEGKVLTKDFIELDKENYYYFNKKELAENGTVKAVPEDNFSDFENYYTVKKIPNNLDSFNAEAKSYSYGNDSNRHKGLFIYYVVNFYGANPVPLVFDLKGNELTISLIKLSEIELLIKSEEDVETVKEIVDSTNETVDKYNKLIANSNEVDLVEDAEASDFTNKFLTDLTSVIEDYKGRKAIDLLVKYNVDVLGASEETSSEIKDSINLVNPIEDLFNSNVSKDKEIKRLEKKYVNPLRNIFKKLEELEDKSDEEVLNDFVEKEQQKEEEQE